MFAVMYETNDGKMLKIYDSLENAQYAAQNAVCGLGWTATVFDYDKENNAYIEFYTV